MDLPESLKLDMSTPALKREAYQLLLQQTRTVCASQRTWYTNLSQFSALVFHSLPDLNWAGFYMADGGILRLGPFQGRVACTEIPFSKGVCGTCAETKAVQIVPDVHLFPGHIACDAASRSELVIPVVVKGAVLAVFDLDSPLPSRFDDVDARGLSDAVHALVDATDWAL